MMKIFENRILYEDLNSKQKENYNFQKISALLADYGYTTIKLSDDWMGADFIAIHFKSKAYLKIQLKGRLVFDKNYLNKDLYLCFYENEQWYIYPHDDLLKEFEDSFKNTESWLKGTYSFPSLSKENYKKLDKYMII